MNKYVIERVQKGHSRNAAQQRQKNRTLMMRISNIRVVWEQRVCHNVYFQYTSITCFLNSSVLSVRHGREAASQIMSRSVTLQNTNHQIEGTFPLFTFSLCTLFSCLPLSLKDDLDWQACCYRNHTMSIVL